MAEVRSSRRGNPTPAVKPPKSNHKKGISALLKRFTSLRYVASSSHLPPPPQPFGPSGSSSTDRSHNSTDRSRSRSSYSTNRGRAASASAGEGASLKHSSIPAASVGRASVDSFLNRPSSIISTDRDVKPSNSTIATSNYSHASDFSSRTPSIRSLTTTITTFHSINPLGAYNPHPNHHHNPNAPPVTYSNPMPNPANPNLDGLSPAQTYQSATANGLLSDNASVLTLASSTRRRRRSFDTDASVRALAPSSLWGGSRESLPLSILSQTLENRAIGERGSLYGRTLETSSRHAVEAISPMVSPNRDSYLAGGRSSRRSSAWGELGGPSDGGMSDAGQGEDLDDGRSYRSGLVSARGSLRSKKSNTKLQTEGLSERANGEDVEERVTPTDVKGKGKEVIHGEGSST